MHSIAPHVIQPSYLRSLGPQLAVLGSLFLSFTFHFFHFFHYI